MDDTNSLEQSIAQNLAGARRIRGMTLVEAAAASGVSVTHLSRMERGERQPSISVLMRLARSYGLSVGQLVGEDTPEPVHVFRGNGTPALQGPDGKYATLSGTTGANLLEAIRLDLPHKGKTSRAAQHPGEEWLLVQEGAIRLEVGSQLLELHPGDAAHFDAQMPHQLHNIGPAKATVYIISAIASAVRMTPHR
uniref:HTH cro/C1-type domain-containing protein n=1 Tax=Rhodococcus sp. NS1 TaxID=402236 RepID=A0A097SQJ9_9NOCA|nr:hypothetical protein LRS1606.372 [Rhodococcus sp. NS1]